MPTYWGLALRAQRRDRTRRAPGAGPARRPVYFDDRSDPARRLPGTHVREISRTSISTTAPATRPARSLPTGSSAMSTPRICVAQVRAGDGRAFAGVQAPEPRERPHARPAATRRRRCARSPPRPTAASRANTTSFAVRSDGPGVAVLTEACAARRTARGQWTARKAVSCDWTTRSRAVVVETAGEHRVTFTYKPRRFFPSQLAFAAGATPFFTGSFRSRGESRPRHERGDPGAPLLRLGRRQPARPRTRHVSRAGVRVSRLRRPAATFSSRPSPATRSTTTITTSAGGPDPFDSTTRADTPTIAPPTASSSSTT